MKYEEYVLRMEILTCIGVQCITHILIIEPIIKQLCIHACIYYYPDAVFLSDIQALIQNILHGDCYRMPYMQRLITCAYNIETYLYSGCQALATVPPTSHNELVPTRPLPHSLGFPSIPSGTFFKDGMLCETIPQL